MDWDDLRIILAVSRAGTLAAAARRLKVNQTTVARRLASAERTLSVRLFERVEGSLHPTKAGEAAISHAARVEQDVQALERSVGGADNRVSGSVRLSAVPVLVNHLIVPALPKLHASHPGLRLALVAEGRNASLVRREADIALRLARPEGGSATLSRRIGHVAFAVYGPRRRSPARLPWITHEEGHAHLPQARYIDKASRADALAPLAVSDAETILHAVRAGLGKSLLPCFAAEGQPGLQRIGGGASVLSRELWLLTHSELRHHARIAAVVSWLEGVAKARLGA